LAVDFKYDNRNPSFGLNNLGLTLDYCLHVKLFLDFINLEMFVQWLECHVWYVKFSSYLTTGFQEGNLGYVRKKVKQVGKADYKNGEEAIADFLPLLSCEKK